MGYYFFFVCDSPPYYIMKRHERWMIIIVTEVQTTGKLTRIILDGFGNQCNEGKIKKYIHFLFLSFPQLHILLPNWNVQQNLRLHSKDTSIGKTQHVRFSSALTSQCDAVIDLINLTFLPPTFGRNPL